VVSGNILASAHGGVGYLLRHLLATSIAAFEGLASTSYIFYRDTVATLVIVVVMVIGDAFPKKIY